MNFSINETSDFEDVADIITKVNMTHKRFQFNCTQNEFHTTSKISFPLNVSITRSSFNLDSKIFYDLKNIEGLNDGWDGNASYKISDKIIKNSKWIFKKITSRLLNKYTDIYPNNHGTITVEWENEETDDILSLEIGDKLISYFCEHQNVPEFFNKKEISISEMSRVSQFLEKIL